MADPMPTPESVAMREWQADALLRRCWPDAGRYVGWRTSRGGRARGGPASPAVSLRPGETPQACAAREWDSGLVRTSEWVSRGVYVLARARDIRDATNGRQVRRDDGPPRA
jgi:hypothetical protein